VLKDGYSSRRFRWLAEMNRNDVVACTVYRPPLELLVESHGN
jgi:hypothetical protein